jgi:hypothetical protein
MTTRIPPEQLEQAAARLDQLADELGQISTWMLSDNHAVHRRRLDIHQSLDWDLAAAGVPAEQRTTLAFGIGYETAVLRWFGQLPDSMNPGGGAPAG